MNVAIYLFWAPADEFTVYKVKQNPVPLATLSHTPAKDISQECSNVMILRNL